MMQTFPGLNNHYCSSRSSLSSMRYIFTANIDHDCNRREKCSAEHVLLPYKTIRLTIDKKHNKQFGNC